MNELDQVRQIGPVTPEWTPQTRADAVRVADAAMTVFADYQVPAGEWHTKLGTYLTPTLRGIEASTDPATVPIRGLRTPGAVITGTEQLGQVSYRYDSTSGGPWVATVRWASDPGAWQVSGIDAWDTWQYMNTPG